MAIEIKNYKCPKCGETYQDSVRKHFPGKPCEKCSKPGYSIICAECGVGFNAPFKPTPGKVMTCGNCTIKNKDLSNIPYFSDLLVFLKIKLGKANITIVRAKNNIYNVLVADGKKQKQICSIELTAKSKDITPVPNDSKLPPFGGLDVKIKARDEKILEILAAFVQQYKSKIISSQFV